VTDVYDIGVTRIDGRKTTMAEYRGKTLLIVNVASACGYTPQYAGLEALYREFKDQGLVVLGFPCNDFGREEPADNDAIAEFCQTTYDVTFPMFAKIPIRGSEGHPLFKWLASQKPGILGLRAIKWNFTKFLVDAGGTVAGRYGMVDTPARIRQDIVTLLATDATAAHPSR
jgi:glutathione peroxidase